MWRGMSILKAMGWLHRFLVPSPQNGYRPNSLESTALGVMLVLIMMTFALANVHSILLVTSNWFTASIIPVALVEMTNEEREAEALGDLTRSTRLDSAAKKKAEDMASQGYFAHDSPTGVTPWHWFSEVGYEYAYAGENLAVHFSESDDVVDAWMDSPGHRANIMNGKYTEIGIGTAKGTYKGSPTVFVVQLFGTPAVPDVLTVRDPKLIPPPTQRVAQVSGDTPAVLSANDPVPVVYSPIPNRKLVTKETPIEALFQRVHAATPEEIELLAQAVPKPDARATKRISELSTSTSRGSAATSPAISRQPTERSFTAKLGDMLYRLLASPSTILATIYLILTFAVVGMLTFAIVVEWRRQHPLQVAYGVGLMATMFLLMSLHLSLTSGAVVI